MGKDIGVETEKDNPPNQTKVEGKSVEEEAKKNVGSTTAEICRDVDVSVTVGIAVTESCNEDISVKTVEIEEGKEKSFSKDSDVEVVPPTDSENYQWITPHRQGRSPGKNKEEMRYGEVSIFSNSYFALCVEGEEETREKRSCCESEQELEVKDRAFILREDKKEGLKEKKKRFFGKANKRCKA